MRLQRLWCFAASAALLTFLSVPSYGAMVVIDNFNGPLDLFHVVNNPTGEWHQTNALATAGHNAVVTYDTTTNPGELTHSFTNTNNNAVQTTLLRDDYKLENDGDYVQMTMSIPTFTGTASDILGGLLLNSGSKTPADRLNNFALELTGQGNIRITGSNGAVLEQVGNGSFGLGSDIVLRIQRVDATTVSASYLLPGSPDFALFNNQTVSGFNAMGVFGGNSRSRTPATMVFDDFVMNVVPEPSGLALVLCGFAVCLRFGRSRKS